MRRRDVDAGDLGRQDHVLERRPPVREHVGHRALDRVEVDAETGGEVGLRVHVDAQDAVALLGERAGEVDRRGRLADAALLVRDRDHVRHRGITSNRRPYGLPQPAGTGKRAAPCYALRVADATPGLSTASRSCSPNLWISAMWTNSARIAPSRAGMMATVLAQRRQMGADRAVSDNDERLAPTRRDARGIAARRGTGAHRATARRRQADGARATGPAARRRVVRRARRVRHAATTGVATTRSSATASSPVTAPSTVGSSSSSARTSPSSADRCPRRTPRRSARSWTWR